MSYRVISSRQTELSWIISPLFFVVGPILLVGTLYFGWFAVYYRIAFPHGRAKLNQRVSDKLRQDSPALPPHRDA
jgi:hypothetical protein